jgi:hypothetical protein
MSYPNRPAGTAHGLEARGGLRSPGRRRLTGRAWTLCLAASVLVLSAPRLAAEHSCVDVTGRAEVMLGDGAFADARNLLESCCDSLGGGERFNCFRVLLQTLTLLGEHRRAAETAEAMVILDPAARLSPGSIAPRALSLFDSLRAGMVGGLSVRSDPSGADLAFDGVPLGQITPWMWYALRGSHQVLVSMEGYQDAVFEVEVVPGVLEPLAATLKRGSRRPASLAKVEVWRSSLLPGWGHVRTGRRRGWAYGAGVLGAALVSSLSYGEYVSAIDDYDAAMDRRDRAGAASAYDDVKRARGTWLTWAGIAVGIHALSILDAWLF